MSSRLPAVQVQAVHEQHHGRGADVGVVEEREEVEDGQERRVERGERGLGGVVVVLAAVDLRHEEIQHDEREDGQAQVDGAQAARAAEAGHGEGGGGAVARGVLCFRVEAVFKFKGQGRVPHLNI